MKKQAGFTLIELIVVIVILGILAVSALPRFVGVDQEARQAAAQGVAAAMSSASAINFGARTANASRGIQVSGTAATICAVGYPAWANAANGLIQGGIPPVASGYTYGNTGATTCGTDGFVVCTVTPTNGTPVNANITCIN